MFHVLNMTPEQLRSKIASEGWDEEFVDKAIENATIGENDVYTNNLSLEDEILRDDDETIRIVYCYQRLLDEDNIPGIYCTVFCNEVPDLYAKHTLMDYAHGGYPFVVSTFEKTSKKTLRLRSVPEVGEAFQQVVKVETDASIDRQSLSTLPPLEHPLGLGYDKVGPGSTAPYRTPGEIRFADTLRFDAGSVEVRRLMQEMFDRYFGNNAPESILLRGRSNSKTSSTAYCTT